MASDLLAEAVVLRAKLAELGAVVRPLPREHGAQFAAYVAYERDRVQVLEAAFARHGPL